MKTTKQGQVVGVTQDNPSFLQYLDKLSIQLGTTIKIIERQDFDNSMDILIDGVTTHISSEVATNILIKQS